MKKRKLITVFLLLSSAFFMVAANNSERKSYGLIDKISQSVAMKIMERASKNDKTNDVVVDHELHGVTPEMITWWWDNIENTERYKLWHPEDHIAFEWIVPPCKGHIGTIQKATEKIGGVPLALSIRWDDPKSVETEFDNILVASIITDDGKLLMRFQHEYESAPYGTRMRSTFHVKKGIPWFIRKGLRKHNIEEMGNFKNFLPDLYQKYIDTN
jgi:DAPG hydrolase PhiG domain